MGLKSLASDTVVVCQRCLTPLGRPRLFWCCARLFICKRKSFLRTHLVSMRRNMKNIVFPLESKATLENKNGLCCFFFFSNGNVNFLQNAQNVQDCLLYAFSKARSRQQSRNPLLVSPNIRAPFCFRCFTRPRGRTKFALLRTARARAQTNSTQNTCQTTHHFQDCAATRPG